MIFSLECDSIIGMRLLTKAASNFTNGVTVQAILDEVNNVSPVPSPRILMTVKPNTTQNSAMQCNAE